MPARASRILVFSASASFLLLPHVVRAVDRPVPARTNLIKAGRITKIVNKPQVKGVSFVLPSAGGSADPTIVGGTTRWCRLDGGNQCETFSLPVSNWIALGNPAGSKGYKYRGAGTNSDPCKSITLKGKVIKASCKHANFSPPFGSAGVGWEMTLGTDRYCAESSAATSAIVKKNSFPVWKAIKANAPVACPVIPTPTPVPTPTPTPAPPYGSASEAFVSSSGGLLR